MLYQKIMSIHCLGKTRLKHNKKGGKGEKSVTRGVHPSAWHEKYSAPENVSKVWKGDYHIRQVAVSDETLKGTQDANRKGRIFGGKKITNEVMPKDKGKKGGESEKLFARNGKKLVSRTPVLKTTLPCKGGLHREI